MNQKERSMYEFEMAFKKSLCLSFSLKMMTLFLPIPGLKTGVNLRQPGLNNNNLFIYSALFNMLGDQKRITTINNLKTINTNIRNIQIYLISKRY